MPVAVETKTSAEWKSVVTDLLSKAREQDNELLVHNLTAEGLALEVELDVFGSAKELVKVKAEIARLKAASESTRVAILHAQKNVESAKASEAIAVETARNESLRSLASKAVAQAAEYTRALYIAVTSANAFKETIRAMIELATANESARHLDRLLRPECYMRAAESVGLRKHIEFAIYQGPRDHVVGLEQEVSVQLGLWLTVPTVPTTKDNGNGK